MITEDEQPVCLTSCSNTHSTDLKIESETSNESVPKQPQQSISKLESFTKEDLIKLVKKQLINQKELKKQLEASKNECDVKANHVKELTSKISNFEGKEDGTSMLLVELVDYKNASIIIKKELQDCKEKLTEKEVIIEELSQCIANLQEEKAETNEQLRQKSVESSELKKSIAEKSHLIAENSKEISLLLAQLNDSRQQMQQEINFLNESLMAKSVELKSEQRTNLARSSEVKRLKCENDTLEARIKSVEEEFRNYKERAEFVFKSSKASDLSNTNDSSLTSQMIVISEANNEALDGEIGQLLELLKQRNAFISQLRTKCSFLEEEIKSSQEYSKTLLDELNALHDSISQIRRQSHLERQKIVGEFEHKFKKEEILRITLENEIKKINEREGVAIKNFKELKLEYERLENELEETKTKILLINDKKHVTPTNSPTPPQNLIQKQQRKTSFSAKKKNNQQQRQTPKPLKLITKIPQDLSQNQRSSFEDDFINRNVTMVDDEAATMNSESLADSLDDLQSMLREAEIEPTGEIPSFNVAELPSDALLLNSDDLQRTYYSYEEYNNLMQQLNSCRELLSESEEINIRVSEQNNLLKEEIRRFERNQHRAKQLENEVCSEYFKNIVLKFLTPPRVFDERTQLLPVLQTILRLDEKEIELVRTNITAQSFSTSSQGSAGDNQKGEGTSFAGWLGWS